MTKYCVDVYNYNFLQALSRTEFPIGINKIILILTMCFCCPVWSKLSMSAFNIKTSLKSLVNTYLPV